MFSSDLKSTKFDSHVTGISPSCKSPSNHHQITTKRAAPPVPPRSSNAAPPSPGVDAVDVGAIWSRLTACELENGHFYSGL